MENFVKATKDNYPNFYIENKNTYLLINSNNEVLAHAVIDPSANCNNIDINVLEKYRGNGYGTSIFKKALNEYKSNYNTTEKLRFEVDSQSRFNSILFKNGGVNIANNDGTLVYILPL